MTEINHRTKEIRSVLVFILFLNWLVAALKVIFGYLIKSQSMIADGFHSFADGASNVIGIVGIGMAAKPRDADHPYGHGKYETFASVGISFLLFLTCLNVLHESIGRLRTPQLPDVDMRGLIIMLCTIGVNIYVMVYERNKGKQLSSLLLVSDAMHTRSDIFTSFSVLVSFAAVKSGFPIFDPLVAIMISVFIAMAGVSVLRQSAKVLCDSAVFDPKLIEDTILGIEGVKRCHKIRTRGSSDAIYVDLHVQVQSSMPMNVAHRLSYKIEDSIKKRFPQIVDVVVHMEPLTSRDG